MLKIKANKPLAPPSITMTVGCLTIAFCSTTGIFDDTTVFGLLSLAMIIYLLVEINQLRRQHPQRWLVNPVVLCSIFTFLLGYSFTNLIFLLPEEDLELVGVVPHVTPAMVKLMGLVSVGAIAMWLGYWSRIACRLSRHRFSSNLQARLLPKTNSLRALSLPILVLVAVCSRLIQIQLGVFGYSSDYDRLIEMASTTQYLTLLSGLGKLALVIASLQYYETQPNLRSRKWLNIVLPIEVFFGFMSGFKSAVVTPFLIVALCQYLRRGKLSKSWIMLALTGLFVAYAVIEPFRNAWNQEARFDGTSFLSIAQTLIDSAYTSSNTAKEGATTILSTLSRVNLSYIGSFAIEYADQFPTLPAGSPEFLKDILLSPLHALLPRFLWESKPLGNLGLWYNQVVIGKSHFSSTAMGPFSYLYFAGGFLAVFTGFYLIGITQRCLFFILQPITSSPGGTVFLAMLPTIVLIDSSVNGIITTLIRQLPLLLILQFFLYKNLTQQPSRAALKTTHTV